MKLLHLNIGQPRRATFAGNEVQSGIWKNPVFSPVWLSALTLAGDVQVDLRYHGGPDRAVCVYPFEHYAAWERRLSTSLNPGAFGENFTTIGLLEEDVRIGDVYSIGGARVQVTQARQPCFKLAMKHGEMELPKWIQDEAKTGFYLRVLKEGYVAPGDDMERIDHDPNRFTVADAFRLITMQKPDPQRVRDLLRNEGISSDWKASLERTLE